jgi:predicted  nucleic acid-binding Zn-ribbon protein
MENILDACISPPGSSQLSNYVVLAEQIPSRLTNCTSLQSKISSGFSSTTLLAKIRNLINVEIKKDIGLCRAFNMSLHRKLISATVALLLTSTLRVQATGPTLPLTLTTSLIDKQRQLPHIVEECSHPLAVSGPTTVSLFEQQNTPYTGRHLQDWQEVLNSELDSQNSYQKDLIVRRIAQIIHDLETRCNTVEEPLRREKEKTQGMEQRLAEIEQHVKSLEGQITDAQDRIDGLDDELSDETKEKHKLKCELRKLQARFDESSRQAEKTLQLVQDELNDKQLELQSRVLTHQEIMRVRDEENAAYNCTIVKLREELEDVYKRHSFLSDEHNNLQHQLAEMEQELSHERDIVRNQSDDVEQLQGRSAKFEDDLHRVELELEDMTRKHDDLQVSHQKLVQSSEAAYRVLEQKYAEDMKIAATKVEEDRNRLSVQEQEALRNSEQAKEAHEKMRRELQKLKTSIPPLDAEIRELNRLCSKQERELTKFKEYHQNVINAAAAMSGFPSQHPAALQSTAQTQIDTTGLRNPRVPRESRRRKSTLPTQEVAPDPSIAAHGFTNAAMENFADASEYGSSDSLSSQGGPTPKRAKPRASSRVLSTQTPHTEKPMFASQTAFRNLPPGKRSALHPMSPNRRHTTFGVRDHDEEGPTQKLRSSKKRRASVQGNEHVHFDMDDFLAGTQLTQGDFVAGTGRIPEEEDETTTEL